MSDRRQELIDECAKYLFLNGWSRAQIAAKQLENHSTPHLEKLLDRAKAAYDRSGINRGDCGTGV